MSTLELFLYNFTPEHLFFKWTESNKMHHIYQKLLSEVNGEHKYLICKYLLDKKFEVLHVAISLDKLYITRS